MDGRKEEWVVSAAAAQIYFSPEGEKRRCKNASAHKTLFAAVGGPNVPVKLPVIVTKGSLRQGWKNASFRSSINSHLQITLFLCHKIEDISNCFKFGTFSQQSLVANISLQVKNCFSSFLPFYAL